MFVCCGSNLTISNDHFTVDEQDGEEKTTTTESETTESIELE